jgi:hypothetical protein
MEIDDGWSCFAKRKRELSHQIGMPGANIRGTFWCGSVTVPQLLDESLHIRGIESELMPATAIRSYRAHAFNSHALRFRTWPAGVTNRSRAAFLILESISELESSLPDMTVVVIITSPVKDTWNKYDSILIMFPDASIKQTALVKSGDRDRMQLRSIRFPSTSIHCDKGYHWYLSVRVAITQWNVTSSGRSSWIECVTVARKFGEKSFIKTKIK